MTPSRRLPTLGARHAPRFPSTAPVSARIPLREVLQGMIRSAPDAPRRAAALPALLLPDGTRRGGLAQLASRAARRWPNRTAVLFDGERWSWRRFDRRAARLAGVLAAQGLRTGDVVAVACGNRPELLLLVVAVARLGGVTALLNPALRGASLEHALETAQARFFAADPGHCHLLPPGFALCRGSEDAPGGWVDVCREASPPPPMHVPARRDPAVYIYTSGTTGLPKASVMTHGRWTKAAGVYGRVLASLRPDDVVYCPLPLFHNLALTTAWGACVATGATLALAPRFSASRYWDDVRATGATVLPYIGELPGFLLAQPPHPGDRQHRVRAAYGVAMRPAVWRAFQERFGVPAIYESYGASEGNVLFLNPFAVPESIGICPASHRLLAWDRDAGQLVRGADGRPREAARGEPGLLVAEVTERYRFDGYTDAEQTEKKLLRDLFEPGDCWFDSGDLLVDRGWFHHGFVDRVGDTFRWKSENVSTTQVEAALLGRPGIRACAVYGVEVPGQPGRAGMAAVVADGLPRDLAAALAAELPGPAVPVFLRPVDSLEVTDTLKNRKVDLQREGWDAPGVLVLTAEGYAPLTEGSRASIRGGLARL